MTVLQDLDMCFARLKQPEHADFTPAEKEQNQNEVLKELLQVMGMDFGFNGQNVPLEEIPAISNEQLLSDVNTLDLECPYENKPSAQDELLSEKCPALTAFLLSPESDNHACDKCEEDKEVKGNDYTEEDTSSPVETKTFIGSPVPDIDMEGIAQHMIMAGENMEQSPTSNDAFENFSETESSSAQKAENDHATGIKLIEELEQELARVKGSKRNAVQAKLNREKKKMYIQSLEQKLKYTEFQRQELSSQNCILQAENEKLKDEMKNLQKLLSNDGAISCFLDQFPKSNSFQVNDCLPIMSNMIAGQKRPADRHEEVIKKLKTNHSDMSPGGTSVAGMCLHLSSATGKVSLQFCAECSRLASN